ncbi:MAG: helix-turn-helix transcriptional regulator [Planctomycetaceae bacterium]|nr:helix-turn-helix transcriptional regulator [Planctomycetaceae bacterium]MBT6485389.1 helix-turn-helix transcriptional regulator [Planctomycetaceae bacterium]MBT6494343.1 helix-turn-helix transcriptional regulator [Planctomycetaceae bacterium]
MAKRNKSLGDFLRAAARKSGRTPYAIAKQCGTTPEVVSRFLRGADIRISTAGKIAEVLGLELTQRKGK